MTGSSQNSQNGATRRGKWADRVAWIALVWVIAIYVGFAYWDHMRGADWLSAFGLPLGRDFFRLVGDFAVPVLVTVLWMQNVRKLSPSREKTALTWLSWSFFVFLFVWWSPLHFTLFGS